MRVPEPIQRYLQTSIKAYCLLQFLVIISIHYLNPSTQELIQTKNHIPPSQQYLDFQLELIQNLQNSGESVTEIDVTMLSHF